MKNIVQLVKTVAAVIATSALLPFGILIAQAAPAQYAVVVGVECTITINGVQAYNYADLAGDEYTIALKAPKNGKVVAHCMNGVGEVPLTSSPNKVGLNFNEHADWASVEANSHVGIRRLPPAAPSAADQAPAQAPAAAQKPQASKSGAAVKEVQTVSHKPSKSHSSKTVVRKHGKVTSTTTASVNNAPAASATTTDSVTAQAEEDMGTAPRDVDSEALATADTEADFANDTSDNIVEGQQIEAADYASANLSLVDRMGGAGTLVGIVILGLVGAAGAISLTRSIILG